MFQVDIESDDRLKLSPLDDADLELDRRHDELGTNEGVTMTTPMACINDFKKDDDESGDTGKENGDSNKLAQMAHSNDDQSEVCDRCIELETAFLSKKLATSIQAYLTRITGRPF